MTTTDRTRTGAVATIYAGITFRSRIEARWAVFMDTLGVTWTYEPEAFDLPGGKYLPDFWLPELEAYYEVKGPAPTDAELRKAQELAEITGHRVYIAAGWIPRILVPNEGNDLHTPEWVDVGDEQSIHYHGPGGDWDWCHRWCICQCGTPDIHFEGLGSRHCRIPNPCPTWDHPRLIAAYDAANNAFGPAKRDETRLAARADVQASAWQDRVCAFLMDNHAQAFTQAEIRAELSPDNPDKAKARVHRAIDHLLDAGLIEKSGGAARQPAYCWKAE